MKCDGSPGSTPQRFVALTTNQFPVKKSEFANVLRAQTSLYGMLTMSWNRLNGMLKIDESTSACVHADDGELGQSGSERRDGNDAVAASAAAAMTYGTRNSLHDAPSVRSM